MNIPLRVAVLLAGFIFGAKPSVTASDWIGNAGDNLFGNPENWSGSAPNTSNSANFGIPASVEFSQSGAASSLGISASTSFLLGGRTFQTSQTQIVGNSSLLVRDGIASLGTVNLEGSIVVTGAGSLIQTYGIQSNSSSTRLIQISDGAAFQSDDISFSSGGFAMQLQSGGVASIGSLNLNSGQSLIISGAGSSLTASSGVGGVGSVRVSDGGSLSAGSMSGQISVISGGSIFAHDLSGGFDASGAGTVINVASFSGGDSNSVISVSDGASAFLGASSSNLLDIASVSVSGNGANLTTSQWLRANAVSVSGEGSSFSAGNLNVNGNLLASDQGNISVNGLSAGSVLVSEGASVKVDSVSSALDSLALSGESSSFTAASSLAVEGSTAIRSGAILKTYSLELRGSTTIHDATITTSEDFSNNGVLNIRNSSVGATQSDRMLSNSGALTGSFSTNYSLSNQGSISIGQGDAMTFRGGSNEEAITVSGGSLEFSQDSFSNYGTIALKGDLRANAGISNSGGIEVSGIGNIWGGNFANQSSVGVFASSTLNFMDDVQNDGTIAIGLDSTAVFYGALSGNGQITGPGTAVILGDLRPGHSPGIQTVEGNLTFGDAFTYVVDIDGSSQGTSYDTVSVGGLLVVDGGLVIALGEDYVPALGDSFEVLTFGAREGEFDRYLGLDLGAGLSLAPEWRETAFVLTVVPEPGATPLALFALAVALGRRRKSGAPAALPTT